MYVQDMYVQKVTIIILRKILSAYVKALPTGMLLVACTLETNNN